MKEKPYGLNSEKFETVHVLASLRIPIGNVIVGHPTWLRCYRNRRCLTISLIFSSGLCQRPRRKLQYTLPMFLVAGHVSVLCLCQLRHIYFAVLHAVIWILCSWSMTFMRLKRRSWSWARFSVPPNTLYVISETGFYSPNDPTNSVKALKEDRS